MKKLCCLLLLITSILQSNVFLQKPTLVSPAQMADIAAEWETSFTWGLGGGCNLTCTYYKGKSGFLMQAYHVPIRSSNFPYYAALKEIIGSYRQSQGQRGYHMAQPVLEFSDQNPASLNIDELCDYLRGKTFIFYTGAGISASGNVGTMNDLMRSLKMDWRKENRVLWKQPFFKEAFLNPQLLTDAFDQFCKSAIENEPTPAHKAVHAIAQHKSQCILTENVDLLQQRAGSTPKIPRPGMCEPDDVKAIQAIVCVGLSHDDRGFLAYFKKHNPDGVIIAIDRGNPNYLSSNDYIVRDDLQTALPTIADFLCADADII